MMAGPFDDAQVQAQRVGHLYEKDPISRKQGDARRIVSKRKCMEAVEHQPERGMRRPLDDLPRLSPQVHMASPGQCLESDAHSSTRRFLGQLVELRRGKFRISLGGG